MINSLSKSLRKISFFGVRCFVLSALIGLTFVLNIVTSVHAQTSAAPWPNKPIRFIVPYAPGGFGDTRARQVSAELSKVLGQQVIVENKAGAGGVLGTDLLAKSAPDGYTMSMGNLAPLAVNRFLMKSLPYDPLKDLQPVVLIEISPLVLTAAPNLPVSNLRELVALAKSKPGTLTFASSGIGGAHHLSGEMFKRIVGVDIQHLPYKGGAPAATDLLGGHVSMMFEMGYAALPSIKAGKIKALAVTSTKRLMQLPDVPTLSESGLSGFESYNWQGIVVPAGTPRAIVDRLNKEVNAMLANGPVKDAINLVASEAAGGTPEQFAAFIRIEGEKWGKVVREAGIKAE